MNVYRYAPPVAIGWTRSILVAALCIAGASLGTLHGWQASTFQTATVSERGARPQGSYRISDLETISETTGGLTLSIPLASLPKGRGGKDFQLNMVYNSALYDTYVDYSTNSNNGTGPGSPLPTAKMIESPSGSWQYAFGYGLEQEWRTTSGGGCPAETVKSVKLRLRMPDGGSKLLRLGGYLSGSTRYGGTPEFQDITGDGFYEYKPDGFRTACSSAPSPLVGDLVYYTDDGSFIRVVISATGVQTGPLSWIVYLPDGSRAFGLGASTTRIFDRNGNYVRVIRITENGLPVTKFVDEISGRQIELRQETGTSQDLVSYQGANAENVTVVISRSIVSVGPRTYHCNWEYASCTSWFNIRTVNQIQRIAPNSVGVLETFAFGYSACTYCGGELNSVTLPSGARYEYSYAFDGWSEWPSMTYLNPVAQKRAIYSEVADGQSTSITDTTDYCFDGRGNSCGSGGVGKSSIVGPDGGRTTNFYSANPSALVFKVERPDGSVVERQWASNRPYFAPAQAFSNPYVRLEVNSIPNAAGTPTRARSRRTSMDRNGNQTLVEEFGWVNYSPTLGSVVPITALPPGAESLLLRSSSADYFYSPGPATNGAVPDSPTAYWYPSAPRQLRAASTRVVRDGAGSVKAYTAYEYDGSTAPPQQGNPTKEKQWDSVKGPNQIANIITTERTFDLFGNLLTEKDPNGNITRFQYNSNLTSRVARYVADGQAVVRTTTFEYDFSI